MSSTIVITDVENRVIQVGGATGPQGPPGTGGGLPAGIEIEADSDTLLRLKYTGSDNVERSIVLPIS